MGTTTTNLALYKPTAGESGWASLVNGNFDTLDTVNTNAVNMGTYVQYPTGSVLTPQNSTAWAAGRKWGLSTTFAATSAQEHAVQIHAHQPAGTVTGAYQKTGLLVYCTTVEDDTADTGSIVAIQGNAHPISANTGGRTWGAVFLSGNVASGTDGNAFGVEVDIMNSFGSDVSTPGLDKQKVGVLNVAWGGPCTSAFTIASDGGSGKFHHGLHMTTTSMVGGATDTFLATSDSRFVVYQNGRVLLSATNVPTAQPTLNITGTQPVTSATNGVQVGPVFSNSTVASLTHRGMYVIPTVTGSANVTLLTGLLLRADTAAGFSGTVATVRTLDIVTPTVGAGTITTAVGLYLGAITTGGTNWGIFTASATQNHQLAGNVRVGATGTPSAVLDVSGGGLGAAGNTATLYVDRTWTAPAGATNANIAQFRATAKGTWTTAHMMYGTQSYISDEATVAEKNVTGAVSNGGLIRLTVTAHGWATGDRVAAQAVGGVPNATGSWIITSIDANTIDLQGSTFAGAYTSGGIVTNRAGYTAFLALVTPSVARGGLTGVNLHADDVNGFFVSNNGTAKATDAFYIARNTGLATEWDSCGSFDGAASNGHLLNNIVGTAAFRGTAYGSSAVPGILSRMARGTSEAPRRAKSNDPLARISGTGGYAADDSTDSIFPGESARIDMYANEDHTLTARGTRMVFYTTGVGATSITERVRIAPADGFDFLSGTFSAYMMRLKNAAWIVGRQAGGSDTNLLRIDASDRLELAAPTIHTGNVGFNSTAPIAKPTVTGAKGSNLALGSLLTALASYGLITDSSTT